VKTRQAISLYLRFVLLALRFVLDPAIVVDSDLVP
jgi:hypothetical protein